jgi:hypothetical protein
MVQIAEIVQVLKTQVPAGTVLTNYGNEASHRSLVKPPSVTPGDYEANAAVFNLRDLDDLIVDMYIIFRKRRNVNKVMTSYGWKHVLEKKRGKYVSNGMFILAAYLSDFRVFWPKENGSYGVNPYFNMELRE